MTVSSETLRSISTPDKLGSRLGTLDFVNGVPRSETVDHHLDYVHALNVYLNGFAGASTYALRTGFHEAGAADNQILTPLPHTEHRPHQQATPPWEQEARR
jgi:hypothetical protein